MLAAPAPAAITLEGLRTFPLVSPDLGVAQSGLEGPRASPPDSPIFDYGGFVGGPDSPGGEQWSPPSSSCPSSPSLRTSPTPCSTPDLALAGTSAQRLRRGDVARRSPLYSNNGHTMSSVNPSPGGKSPPPTRGACGMKRTRDPPLSPLLSAKRLCCDPVSTLQSQDPQGKGLGGRAPRKSDPGNFFVP